MHYPLLAEFKSSVCATIKEGSSNMSLPLIIEQIFNAQPGRAFPEEMGKQTKIDLTTSLPHKPKCGPQAAPNMVTVHGRLYPTKSMFSFGYSLSMNDDAGSALINCIPNGGTL